MEITKIAKVSEEEKEALINAGKILGSFSAAKANHELDAFDEVTDELFKALKKVLDELVVENTNE